MDVVTCQPASHRIARLVMEIVTDHARRCKPANTQSERLAPPTALRDPLVSAKGGKREISDVGRWRAPAAAANEDNSDEWPSATTAAILCATTIAPPPGTWSASQASSAPPRSCPAPQQLVVPRLRHRDGDAGRLKFGFPLSFFAVARPSPRNFSGVAKNMIKP